MLEHIKDWWPAAAAFLTYVAGALGWLFKVDHQGKTNATGIRALHKLRNEDLAAAARLRAEDLAEAARQRAEDREAAAESRNQVHEMLAEMRTDIKTLLARRE